MEAKDKMMFMNSIPNLDNESIICPKCNAENEAGNNFCISCGSPLEIFVKEDAETPSVTQDEQVPVSSENEESAPKESAPAFEPVQQIPPVKKGTAHPPKSDSEPPVTKKKSKPEPVFVEVPPAFAEGLPEWSIEPPQVLVRRR